MDAGKQQLRGIAKDMRNTQLSPDETTRRILDRLLFLEIITEDERIHIAELYEEKLRKESVK